MSAVKYSPTEQAVLSLLNETTDGLNIAQLANMYYAKRDRPWNAEIVIRAAVRELIDKTLFNDEKFTVEKIKQGGCKPALFRVKINKKKKRKTTLVS